MAGSLLSEAQRKRLEEYLDQTTDPQRKRAQLILLYDDGQQTYQASEAAGFSRSQARYWKHQFLLNGFSIFPGLMEVEEGEESEILSDTHQNENITEEETAEIEDDRIHGELPYPNVVENPGIIPTDTLAEAGRKIWLYQFAHMLANEEPTRVGDDIEGLHDMRVATRRMRTAYDVFGIALKPKVVKKQLKGLRATGRTLGRVRDMDVLIDKLVAYLNEQPLVAQEDLEPLLASWRNERESGRQVLMTYLDSSEYIAFKNEFNYFVQTPGYGLRKFSDSVVSPNRVLEIVPALIYTRLGTVRAYDSILQNASDTQLHALRIEVKRLRYAIEYFKEVLGKESSQVIQELKRIQDHLGDFHDAVVACGLVTDFLNNWEKNQLSRPLIERENPEQIVKYLAYLHAERHRLLVTMPEVWQIFNGPNFRENLAKAVAVL